MGTNELILVVPRGRLLSPGGLDGFFAGEVDTYAESIRRHGEFRRRGDVEDDPLLKQIIPYLIIRHRDQIFLFQRTDRGGERRLHGLYSIGVGGHIAREDIRDTVDLLAAGLERELHEELVIANGWRARPVGVLNEEDTPVSRVHFGVVYVIDTDDSAVRVQEADRLSGHLATAAEVEEVRARMESWSRRILDVVDPFVL